MTLLTNDSVVKKIKKVAVEEKKNVQDELPVTETVDESKKNSEEKEAVVGPEMSGILEFLDEDERQKVLRVACSLEISENTRLHKSLTQYKKQISEHNAKLKNAQNQKYYNPHYNKPENEPDFFKEVSEDGTKRFMAILDALFRMEGLELYLAKKVIFVIPRKKGWKID